MRPRRVKEFARLTDIDHALSSLFKRINIEKMASEKLPLIDALNRVLADDFPAPLNLPRFDRAAVDGYALRARDTYGASPVNPLILNIVGISESGSQPVVKVTMNHAVRIDTGAPMPKGADSVIMKEYIERIGSDKVEIYRSVSPGKNVSKRGEDVRKDETILFRGNFLHPQDLGLLAAMGMHSIEVVKKPLVAVLSTGNELVEPGEIVEPGMIVDSNRLTLMAMIEKSGGEPVDLGLVKDDVEEIGARISMALKKVDVMLVSGGTSVGDRDFLPSVVDSLGSPGVIVHGVSMIPGKPTGIAAVNDTPIILLPGFPVATMLSFEVFVKPTILKMLGTSLKNVQRHLVDARVTRRVPSRLGYKTFLRVFVRKREGRYLADPIRTTGSGIMSSMIKANGLIIIPEDKEGLEEGEDVEVLIFKPVGE